MASLSTESVTNLLLAQEGIDTCIDIDDHFTRLPNLTWTLYTFALRTDNAIDHHFTRHDAFLALAEFDSCTFAAFSAEFATKVPQGEISRELDRELAREPERE